MEGNKLKLVNYSESSESSSSPEPEIKYQYPKIAVVNPVQSVRQEPEQPTFEHDETTEFDPDESLTRQPIPLLVMINLKRQEEKVTFLNKTSLKYP